LNIISKSDCQSDATVQSTANSLIAYFTSYKFILTAMLFKNLFNIIEPANKQFQARDLDILVATNLIENAKLKIKVFREEGFDDIQSATDNFVTNSKVAFKLLKTSSKKRVPKKSGEISNDEPINDPLYKFKVETFYTVCDITLTECFDSSNNILRDIVLLSYKRMLEVKSDSTSLPTDAFSKVCNAYSKFINRDNLLTEYLQFVNNFEEIMNTVCLPKQLHLNNSVSSNEETDELEISYTSNTIKYRYKCRTDIL